MTMEHSPLRFSLDLWPDYPLSSFAWTSTVIIGALTCLLFYLRANVVTSSKHEAAQSERRPIDDLPDMEKFLCANVKVAKILIHPIKSCRGSSLLEARYTPEGLQHDRSFAIIDKSTHKVYTARELPNMVLIHPIIHDSADQGSCMTVSFPADSGCEPFAVPLMPSAETLGDWEIVQDIKLWGRDDIDGYVAESIDQEPRGRPSATLSRFLEREALLVLKGPRPRPCAPTRTHPDLKATFVFQDGYPLLVTSEESLLSLQEQVRAQVGIQGVEERWKDEDLKMERFRPNIVLCGAEIPWAEDMWETLRIGKNESTITLVSKCTRCLLPNVDPDTGIRDKAVPFKVLMKFRTGKDPARLSKPCFGCNGVPNGTGIVRLGDTVEIVKLIR